jgi:hypothetical protein
MVWSGLDCASPIKWITSYSPGQRVGRETPPDAMGAGPKTREARADSYQSMMEQMKRPGSCSVG